MRKFMHTIYLIIIAVLATLLYVETQYQQQEQHQREVERSQQYRDIQTGLQDLGQQFSELRSQVTLPPPTERPERHAPEPPAIVQFDFSREQLERLRDVQPIDEDWSLQQEGELRSRLTSENMERFLVNEVRCAVSLCFIEAEVTEGTEDGFEQFMRLLGSTVDESRFERIINYFDEDRVLHIYLIRRVEPEP